MLICLYCKHKALDTTAQHSFVSSLAKKNVASGAIVFLLTTESLLYMSLVLVKHVLGLGSCKRRSVTLLSAFIFPQLIQYYSVPTNQTI